MDKDFGQAPAIIAAPGSREEWLLARRSKITASDVAAILRVPGAYGTPFSVWAEKLGAEPDEKTSDWVLFGRDVEGAIATGYERKYRRPVKDLGGFTLQQHPTIPWLAATLDRETAGSEEWPAPAEGSGPLELKAPALHKSNEWSEAPPTPYLIQVQIQMACTGAAWGSIVALFGGVKLGEPVDILRDPRFLKAAYPALEKFWMKVQRREPPEPDGDPATTEAIKRLWSADDGETITLDQQTLEAADLLDEAKALRKKADDQIAELSNRLRVRMGSATFGNLPDRSSLGLKVEPRRAHAVKASSPRVLRRHYPSAFLRKITQGES